MSKKDDKFVWYNDPKIWIIGAITVTVVLQIVAAFLLAP